MRESRRIRILRIRRAANLLTAVAYEELFDRQLGSAFEVSIAPLEAWCASVFGAPGTVFDLDAAASRFAAATAGQDFFCPNYECIPLAPLLLAVRNRARSHVRMLFIAHAAGAYSFEWALMRPLLAAGDVIIAPSDSAGRTIAHLCPEVAAFVRVIPHPMAPLPRTPRANGAPRIVSLGRVHAEKLIHRQIEAMAILRARGMRALRMEIGGPLDDGGWAGPHPYTRTLREKARRLRVDDHVTFAGAVRGESAKGAFLSGARAVINLSITIEESFPKTPIEALGVGVPVVGTNWNGLRDTVGVFGRLVPVVASGRTGGSMDVDAEQVADAIESLLEHPPSAADCIAWTEQFSPAAILPRYRAVLEDATELARRDASLPDWPEASEGAASRGGLLATAAPLAALSWRELFASHLSWCDAVRRSWSGVEVMADTDGARIRGIVLQSIDPALKHFFARLTPPSGRSSASASRPEVGALDILARIAHAANDAGPVVGRVACVFALIRAGRLTEAATAIDTLAADGLQPSAVMYWRAELATACGDARGALAFSLACVQAGELEESDWPVARQLASTARRAGDPGVALPTLLAWLSRFPDAQESGPIWLDAAVNTLRADETTVAAAAEYHAHARALLGDMPPIKKCEAMIARTRHARALVA